MSRTYKHSRQRELKVSLNKRKSELGDKATGMAVSAHNCFDPIIRKINSEFYRGNLRHGNKRHYEAYMKWKLRKSYRYKTDSHILEAFWLKGDVIY